jgi:hypothetical protein
LVVTFNTIYILKLYIFTLCDNIIDLSYIALFLCSILMFFKENYYLNLFSDSELTDADAPHDSVSESGSTEGWGAGGGGPNPSNPDAIMADASEDLSNDEASDNISVDARSEEFGPVIELPNDDSRVNYNGAQDTPSFG